MDNRRDSFTVKLNHYRRGRQVDIRTDWEDRKLDVMTKLLKEKFTNPDLKEKLLATGDQLLVEDNTWGDRFWGQVGGVGENHLGKLLMQVRKEYRYEEVINGATNP